MMSDLGTYHIQLGGQMNEKEINVLSPLQLTIEQADNASTLLSIYTDQSGLIGLIRHLHSRGHTLLSIKRQT